MGKVFWNNREIPQPPGAHIDSSDGRVFVYLDEGKPVRESRKVTVGHATSQTMMHPNEKFRQMYPALWREHYGESGLARHVMRCGMYALTLGAGWQTDLYPILHDVYGVRNANYIMDYVMFSIFQHSNVAQTFPDRMRDEVLFSERAPDDTRLSALFSKDMDEESNFRFRDAWLARCVADGLRRVWLSIDGSNNDCSVTGSEIVEGGNAKSHKNTGVVGYMYAVNAESGRPVTYMVYNGGKVDAKALQAMVSYLHGHGVEVEGVILDRGFCTHDVFAILESLGYQYVVMLKSNVEGHTAMMADHSGEIHWNVRHLVGMGGLFGVTGRKKLFKEHPDEAFVTLFFDGKNASERSVTLLNKVFSAFGKAKAELEAGTAPVIPASLQKYLGVVENENGRAVQCNFRELQEAIDGKGFCSIASSADLPPGEVDRLYHLRDASETQYMILKSQLGCSVTRVHSTEGIQGKFAACFMAAVIRNEIMSACRKAGLATNKMLLEVDRLMLLLNGNGLYSAIHDESSRQKELLASFDILPEDFDSIAGDVNRRLGNPVHSQLRMKPAHRVEGKRRVGRPAGTTRKTEAAPSEEAKPKRGRGRPKGSKNKKTLEKLNAAATLEAKEKRGPGRPKGSRNKPKIQDVAAAEKRGRGRPKGSRNRPKPELR
jgi:hypothetical protein